MPLLIFAVIALVGGAIQAYRRRGQGHLGADIMMVWWFVVAVGLGGLLGAGYHLFDGPATAEEIGYTRGDGGFQYENAMGDLAIAVAALLAARVRGHFWLALLVILSIQFLGDAGGHLYFWIAEGDTKPYNVGVPLAMDFIIPVVTTILYTLSWRGGGDAHPHRQSDIPQLTRSR